MNNTATSHFQASRAILASLQNSQQRLSGLMKRFSHGGIGIQPEDVVRGCLRDMIAHFTALASASKEDLGPGIREAEAALIEALKLLEEEGAGHV